MLGPTHPTGRFAGTEQCGSVPTTPHASSQDSLLTKRILAENPIRPILNPATISQTYPIEAIAA